MEYPIEITQNIFPESLDTLSLQSYRNDKLEPGLLPESIRRLVIVNNLFKPITPGVLPTRLRQLKICSVDGVTRRILPNTLKFLTIMDFRTPITSEQLPESLTWLTTDGDIPILSKDSKLLTLDLAGFKARQHIQYGQLPDSITRLSIPRATGQNKGNTAWPPLLSHVTLGTTSHFRFDGTFPKTLRSVGVRDPIQLEGQLPRFTTKIDSLHLTIYLLAEKATAKKLLRFIKSLYISVPNVTTYYLKFLDGSLMKLRRLDKRYTLSVFQRSSDPRSLYIAWLYSRYLSSDVNAECHSLGLQARLTNRFNKEDNNNTFVQIMTIPDAVAQTKMK
ncbi:hypothetical protein SAMD00019534_001720 [Acytostelium subglobosum LB1]|uniref:hypothetical protein n=1 Tax=Acytostelium subglobosum LB1 TaxID=1410327 RepID=UPI00064484EB|nr:hypothetical protein SAMD00019534_001720 [Acytostelium subglobosum LB1]GAM16997.1 hypothetical protein SAMD00019534_001720 [Acytostelium subglobosum LB1]|eukprot:XP_012759059.1 hypothetical protein SAMD00019534_001720 [Acytostelium subglobosum LB1]